MALAHALGIPRSGMARLLDGLEGRGLTERVASPQDRRSHALRLTGKGKALVAEHERRLIRKVTPAGHKQLLATLALFAT